MSNNELFTSGLTLLVASGLITWVLNVRRNRRLDQTAENRAETDAVVAIAAAAGELTDAAAILIHPLKERIEALEDAEKEMRLALARHEKIVNSFIVYTTALRGQLTKAEIEPHPLPEPLAGFQFD